MQMTVYITDGRLYGNLDGYTAKIGTHLMKGYSPCIIRMLESITAIGKTPKEAEAELRKQFVEIKEFFDYTHLNPEHFMVE